MKLLLRIYVDGSSKGVVIGSGMAVVDVDDMVETYSSHRLMMYTEAACAEYFALQEALDYLIRSNRKNAFIYTDNIHFFSMFKKEGNVFLLRRPTSSVPSVLKPFIEAVHSKLYELSKVKKGRIIVKKLELDTTENIFYHNVAHVESRRYIDEAHVIYTVKSELLFEEDAMSKRKMNQTRISQGLNSESWVLEEKSKERI